MLADRFHRCDFGDVVAEVSLDAHLEGHVAGGAADAGAVEADADDAGGRDVNEFEVSAVGLDGGPDTFQDTRNAVAKAVAPGLGLSGHR